MRLCVEAPDSPTQYRLWWTLDRIRRSWSYPAWFSPQTELKLINIRFGTMRLMKLSDVSFFLSSRNFFERITSYLMAHDPNFCAYLRARVLHSLFLFYFQFWAPELGRFPLSLMTRCRFVMDSPRWLSDACTVLLPVRSSKGLLIKGLWGSLFIHRSLCRELIVSNISR